MKFSIKKKQTKSVKFSLKKSGRNHVAKTAFEDLTSEANSNIQITSLDDIGKSKDKSKKPELVIKPRPNKDSWEARRRRALDSTTKSDDAKKLTYGLNTNQVKGTKDMPKKRNVKVEQPQDTHNVTETTSESYKKVPVEEFGIAMLRGMGWKGTAKDAEKQAKREDHDRKSRPLLLGLGAKPSKGQMESSYRVTSARYEPVVKKSE